MPTDETQLAVITTKLDRLTTDVKETKEMVQQNYVTQDQFKGALKPLNAFMYGLIGVSMGFLLVTIFNLIPKGP